MSDLDLLRTLCSCCEGVELETPVERWNRPGLSALDYRAGTHGRFKASMEAGISIREALSALTTRDSGDWTVALLDAWAVVLDVLTFYQERAANEGFLRTATERRSLLELARLVGYEPRPGVAAATHLAFRVSGSTLPDPGGPARPRAVVLPPTVEIPAGTRAQSSPGSGELPQPFETSDDLEAREEYNELRPRLTEPQLFDQNTRRFFLEGTATGLAAGDWVVLNAPERANPDDPGNVAPVALRVVKVTTDDEKGWTKVRLTAPADDDTGGGEGFHYSDFLQTFQASSSSLFTGFSLGGGAELQLKTFAQSFKLSGTEIASLEQIYNLEPGAFGRLVGAQPPEPEPPAKAGFFALRVRSHVFGHNAARWKTLPQFWRSGTGDDGGDDVLVLDLTLEIGAPAFGRNWDTTPPAVHEDSAGNPYTDTYGGEDPILLLERDFPQVVPESNELAYSWLVLRGTGDNGKTAVYRVKETQEVSRADFGLSGKSTRVSISGPKDDSGASLDDFPFRDSVVHTASEELTLARVPVEDEVEGQTMDLDHVLEIQLEAGRRVAVSGQRTDEGGSGIVASEIAVVKDTETLAGFTRVTFENDLKHTYRRDTVTLNANVVAATHGETRREVLGDGDAATPFQRFRLQHKPLTHVSAVNPSGAESTLDLRIRGVRWHEASSFFPLGPKDRRYVLRRDDDGATRVLFGDGVRGERLPTGSSNVTAAYRTGLGLAGHVDAGRISMLATRPLGVDEVINPVPARGGEDAESRDRMRDNAPLTVRTLDRIVSLEDFADFARAFSGIGKAHAARVWDGERWVIHVTLASADGEEVDDKLQGTLREAMDAAREPHAPLVLGSLRKRFFEVQARLQVHPDHVPETVAAAADAALQEAFSFEARELGQRVAQSDVVTLLQEIPGVVAVDLDRFQRLDAPGSAAARARHLDALPAGLVGSGGAAELVGTEILLLAPGPVPLVAVEALDAPEDDDEEETS